MITGLAATKGDISAEAARVNGEFDKVSTHINSLGSGINNQISDLEEEISGYSTTAAENSDDIDILQSWAQGAETRITTVEAHNSPPEGYLTGTVGNYTLHAKCNAAGNFTANVHLVYSPGVVVSNTTYDDALATFYGGINWTTANTTVYVSTLTYNSTAWLVSQVWFNIGTFEMAANNETAVAIPFLGLNSTYAPNFVYVEVWPVLK
jgi:hypothetical protein